MVLICPLLFQGLQRRATPHPSELKVMKKVIEERRNEAYTSRSDGADENEDQQVHFIKLLIQSICSSSSYTAVTFGCGFLPGEAAQWPVQSEPWLPSLQQHTVGHLARGQAQRCCKLSEGGSCRWPLSSGRRRVGWDGGGVHWGDYYFGLIGFNNSTHLSVVNTLGLIFCHY